MKNKGVLKLAGDATADAAKAAKKAAKNAAKKAKKAGKAALPFDLDSLGLGFLSKYDFDLDELGNVGIFARRYIRKHPAQAVVIGAGIGFFLGMTTKDLVEGAQKQEAA